MGCVNSVPNEKKKMSDFDIYVITQALFGKKLTSSVRNITIEKDGTKNILYIEDNPVYHVLITNILKKIENNTNKFDLTIKSTINDAVKYIDQCHNNIDLILLDVILPDGYCDVILDKLLEKKFDMNHIIIISRLDDLDNITRKYNQKISNKLSYCSKPINLNHFQKTLESIFIQKHMNILEDIEEEEEEEKNINGEKKENIPPIHEHKIHKMQPFNVINVR